MQVSRYTQTTYGNYITTKWDVIVAGGRPAGFFAAIRCAELNPDLHVLILKNQPDAGQSLISAAALQTHACFDPAHTSRRMALRGAFTRFQPLDTVKWFETHGVKLKAESDNRMFPITDSAKTIADILLFAAKNAGVKVHVGATLLKAEKNPKGGFKLEVRNASVEPSRNEANVLPLQTKKLLIATGSDSKTREIVKSLGHSIEEPVPSLFTFNVKDKRIDGLAGVAVEHVSKNGWDHTTGPFAHHTLGFKRPRCSETLRLGRTHFI